MQTYVGQRIDLNDGRQVRIVQNGGVALAAGHVVSGPATVANWQNMTVTAVQAYSANGNTPATATVTLGGTAVLANEWMGGYALVYTGTGAGQILAIASNTAQTSTTGAATITFGDAPVTALDTTSTISVILNPAGSIYGTDYTTHGVVTCPTSAYGPIQGVAFYAIPASTATVAQYGVVATQGIWGALIHGSVTAGLGVEASTQSTPVAGAVETYAVANGLLLGNAVYTGVDTKYGFVNFSI